MAREKIIDKDFSGKDFTDITGGTTEFTGYYRNCNFSNAKFNNVKFNAVAVNCRFDGADFTNADIYRLYSPGSTFKDAKFKQRFVNTAYHKLLSMFNVAHNHQIIYELIRRWVMINYPKDSVYRRKGLKQIQVIKDRPDLSWAELTRMMDDTFIKKGFRIFKNVKPLYNKLQEQRPEVEPEDLKNERLNTVSR